MRFVRAFGITAFLAMAGCSSTGQPHPPLRVGDWIESPPFRTAVYYTNQPDFDIAHPEGVHLATAPLVVWVSSDQGATWKQVGQIEIDQSRLEFRAPADGTYWVRFAGPLRGSAPPPGHPHAIYIVHRQGPLAKLSIEPSPWEDAGHTRPRRFGAAQEVQLSWDVTSAYPDLNQTRLQSCFQGSQEWMNVAVLRSAKGNMLVQVPRQALAAGGMQFRLLAADKAGNTAQVVTDPIRVLPEPQVQPSTEPATAPATQPVTQPATQPASEPATVPSQPATLPASQPATEPASIPASPIATEPSTKPSSEPATGPSTQAATDPATAPATEPSTEPPSQPATEPATEPASRPATEPATGSASLPSTQPATQTATEPATEPSSQPATETSTQPATEVATSPSTEVASAPSTEPSTQPATEPSTEPSSQQATEPTTAPTTQPTTAPGTEPETQPTTEPATEPATLPATEPSTEPTTEPASMPSTRPTTEPVTQPSTEPATQPATTPATEPSSLPATAPATEPSTQPTTEVATGPASQPATVPTTQPAAAPTSQPASQPATEPATQPSTWPASMPSPEKGGWPAPDTKLQASSAQELSWLPQAARKYQTLELHFSADDGETWWKLAAIQPGAPTAWKVPADATKQARLRVVARDRGQIVTLVISPRFEVSGDTSSQPSSAPATAAGNEN